MKKTVSGLIAGWRGWIKKRKENQFLAVTAGALGWREAEGKIAGNFVIITIAFNNPRVVRHQVRLLDKNLRDKFTHIVVDNSDHRKTSMAIQNTCAEFSRPYLKLVSNPNAKGSDSHALALNWCMRQLVNKFKPAYFGFIDHDIYPVREERIIPILDRQNIYGLKQERGAVWYLWPGFCFFKYAENHAGHFNFRPGRVRNFNVDTGGMLYESLYSQLDENKFSFAAETYENLRAGGVVQSDMVAYIGNWMHSFNGSYWMEVADKEKELESLINRYLNN